jgi:hypothetical protein
VQLFTPVVCRNGSRLSKRPKTAKRIALRIMNTRKPRPVRMALNFSPLKLKKSHDVLSRVEGIN